MSVYITSDHRSLAFYRRPYVRVRGRRIGGASTGGGFLFRTVI